MKFPIKFFHHETIELDDAQMKEITIETLRKQFKIPEGAFINKDDELVHIVDAHTSHSFEICKVIRKATKTDKAAVLILYNILNVDKG